MAKKWLDRYRIDSETCLFSFRVGLLSVWYRIRHAFVGVGGGCGDEMDFQKKKEKEDRLLLVVVVVVSYMY